MKEEKNPAQHGGGPATNVKKEIILHQNEGVQKPQQKQ